MKFGIFLNFWFLVLLGDKVLNFNKSPLTNLYAYLQKKTSNFRNNILEFANILWNEQKYNAIQSLDADKLLEDAG